MRAKTTAGIGALSLVVACLAAFIPSAARGDNTRWGANYFPNVTLTTQDGVKVRFYDDLIKGKIVAIDLIYTSCKYACPLETARLAQVQKILGDKMGREVFFYSISIDPEHDTPAVLKEYASRYHAGPGWLFLTGRQQDIDLLSRKLGLYNEPLRPGKDGHAPALLVGNETTGQWMRNNALDNPGFLATTIRDWMTSWRNSRGPIKSYADVPKLEFEAGQYTFTTHCAPCHTIGQGDKIGPDLRGVTKLRDRAWLTRFITIPDEVIAGGDPIARDLVKKYSQKMPRLGLNDQDAALVLQYIEQQSAARDRGETPAAPASSMPGTPTAAAAPVMVPRVVHADDATVKRMIEGYLAIQRALTADSLVGIAAAAADIGSSAATIAGAGESIRRAAEHLRGASALKDARASFGEMSDALMIYLKTTDARLGDDVNVAYCPMLHKYWLQKGEKIQNPFYGQEMADCGRLNAVLPDLAR